MPKIKEEVFTDKKVDLRMWGKVLKYARPFYKFIAMVFLFMSLSSLCDVINPLIMSRLIDNNLVPRTWDGAPLYIGLYAMVVTFQILTTGQASSSPRTGDESNLGLWAAFLLLSGTAVVVLLPKLRKHEM